MNWLLVLTLLLQVTQASAALNGPEEQALAELLAAAPQAQYSHWGFKRPSEPAEIPSWGPERNSQFRPGTRVRDLLDSKGRILLYRNIRGPYVRSFVDGGNGHIAREGGAYSYSLTPSIVKNWASPELPEAYSLIAVQDIHTDQLKTKVNGKMVPGEGAATHIVPLKPAFPVDKISYYEEVKVPVAKERVVAIVSQKDLAAAVDSFGGKPFDSKEFLRRVGASPSFQSLESWEKRIPGTLAEIKAAASLFTKVEYAPDRYNFITGDPKIDMWGTKFHFPGGTKISDLMNNKGELLLFRAIQRPYEKDFTDAPFVKHEFRSYSYSLSPDWAAGWGEGNMGPPPYDKHILIALQNVEKDQLRFRRAWRQKIDEPLPDHARMNHGVSDQGHRWVSIWPDLEPSMPAVITGSGSEVKVPVGKEKVVAVLPHEEFKRILKSFEGKKYSLKELMERIIASPLLQLPNARVPNSCGANFAATANR